jgi:hypothetical protein
MTGSDVAKKLAERLDWKLWNLGAYNTVRTAAGADSTAVFMQRVVEGAAAVIARSSAEGTAPTARPRRRLHVFM